MWEKSQPRFIMPKCVAMAAGRSGYMYEMGNVG
jgi:hypothetical protein